MVSDKTGSFLTSFFYCAHSHNNSFATGTMSIALMWSKIISIQLGALPLWNLALCAKETLISPFEW